VGQDGVEIAGGKISHGLIGSTERDDGAGGAKVFLGIGSLDGAALDANALAFKCGDIDVLGCSSDELGRVRREIVLAEVDGLQALVGNGHAGHDGVVVASKQVGNDRIPVVD